jgi:hypothetical protein
MAARAIVEETARSVINVDILVPGFYSLEDEKINDHANTMDVCFCRDWVFDGG